MRILPFATPVVVAAWLAGAAWGAAPGPHDPPNGPPPPPPVHAVRLPAPVVVDGALTEPAWQGPASFTRFVQADPQEGAAPSESTWVWLAYDDEALYFAVRCWDSHPDSIIANLVRRDVVVAADRVMLYLDPFHDKRGGYYFGINAAGVLYDGTLFNDGWDDDSWDGVWQGRARRDARGWTAELRIPLTQLRYRPGAEQVWGVNCRRRIERRNETDGFVYTPRRESGFVSRFPDMLGLTNGHRTQSFELLPYSTGKAEYLVHDPGDPFHDGSRYTPGVGADLRTNVGNNLTLNATVNPDFGQVEVDPAVVNLSDVESYFQEKRPFFTENARIFAFGNEGASDYWGFNWPEPQFFYSRRIGRAPEGGLPDTTEFSDVPLATRILGAAKLTGKPAPGWNFGTLHALTQGETGRFKAGRLDSTMAVEPLTYYGIARGQREFKGGYNGLGLMASTVARRFRADGLADQLNRQSLVTGLDGWHFLDAKKLWVVSGWASATRVAGTPTRIADLEIAPRHYFQRPVLEALDPVKVLAAARREGGLE